jgi:hypothetical protein
MKFGRRKTLEECPDKPLSWHFFRFITEALYPQEACHFFRTCSIIMASLRRLKSAGLRA